MTSVSEQLDAICDAFEDALKENRAPQIDDFIAEIGPDFRGQLFQLLLEIELEYRVQSGGEILELEVYAAFPQFADQVHNAIMSAKRRTESEMNSAARKQPQMEPKHQVLLRVVSGPLAGRDFPFTEHHTLVAGRSRKAQLQLSEDRRLSRFHCRFEIRPPDCVIIDLGSRNGTILNGIRVQTSQVAHRDQVQIGDTCLKVEIATINDDANTLHPTLTPDRQNGEENRDAESRSELPQIPGYFLEHELGQGSMGAVYRAKQLASEKLCAIKVLHPTVTADRRNIQRFVREASVIMQLRHKRIVESIEFGLAGDAPFLVMEHIQQAPWRSLLESTNLAERIRVVAGIMVRTLEGLHYAHCQKIVHRDLKPSNLLVFQSGRKLSVKLADFGLAKNFMNAGFSGFSTSNEICGTIAYMPPEQIIDCRNSKPACDIYAAGVCLYYMLSGHVPFEASNISTQISMILNKKPTPLSDHITGLPAGLSTLVSRALQREPQKRFSSADEMMKALLPFATRAKGESDE